VADRGFVYISQKGGGDGANSNKTSKKLVLLYFGFFYIPQSILDLLRPQSKELGRGPSEIVSTF